MPRGGSKPGERRGGRVKGVPNRATTELALIAERAGVEVHAQGRKLAKEILEDMMYFAVGEAIRYQPLLANGDKNPKADEEKFERYLKLTSEVASKLAPYQSPTFRAVMVSSAGPSVDDDQNPGNVIPLDDAIGAARVYRRIVAAGGKR